MNDAWKKIDITKYYAKNLRKLAAEFFVSHMPSVDIGSDIRYFIRVWEDQSGFFWGYPNLARRNMDGKIQWIEGKGATIEEAFKDTFEKFVKTIEDFIQPQSLKISSEQEREQLQRQLVYRDSRFF